MKFNLNTKSGMTMLFLASIISIVSCKKSNEVESSLSLNNEVAAVVINYSDTVVGNYANPASGPGAYDTVYFNAINGTSSSTLPFTHHIIFYGYNNGVIYKANAGDDFRYLNTDDPITSMTPTDFSNATAVPTGFSENTATDDDNDPPAANGWWNYNRTLRQVVATKNVIFFYRAAAPGSSIYAFRVVQAYGLGTATWNNGNYWIEGGGPVTP
ncbi:hypothetical protein [Gynurincola endophyticus]|uniref:hypothetical protein n=1 Tax=Gynurincola endophyticus TaxID=2479004 RepID=UPI000F8F637D|nr:hypothetical protein [Gynurincola endophyticus]